MEQVKNQKQVMDYAFVYSVVLSALYVAGSQIEEHRTVSKGLEANKYVRVQF